MMKPKTFFITALLLSLLVSLLFPAINGHVDSSRVLHKDFEWRYKGRDPNIAWLTAAYLLENQERFDSIIAGSSRVYGGFAVEQLGDGWFKMDYPGAFAREHRYNLELFIEKGVKLKKVWVALDDYMIYDSRNNDKEYFYRLYPRDPLDWVAAYKFYLFKKPKKLERDILKGKIPLSGHNEWILDLYGSRVKIPFDTDREHREFMHSIPGYQASMSETKKLNTDAVIEDLAKIKALCDENGIELVFFFTPRYYKTKLARNPEDLADFRRKLVRITPFWDFSGLNRYAFDYHYWMETSHFTPRLGIKVIDRLRGGGEEDFGVFVDENNIDAVLRKRFNRAVKKLPDLASKDSRVVPSPAYLSGKEPMEESGMVREVLPDGERLWLASSGQGKLLYIDLLVDGAGELSLGCGATETPLASSLERGRNQRWLAFPEGCDGRPWLALSGVAGEHQFTELAWLTIKPPIGE